MGDKFTTQISFDLVDRLLGDDEDKAKKRIKKPKQKVSRHPPIKKPNASFLPPPIYLPVSSAAAEPNGRVAELEAIESILEESKKVLEKLDEKEGSMIQELTLKAKELRDKEFKLPYQKPVPCMKERQACLQCYQENFKEPLRCGVATKAFADCARQARQQASSNEG